MDRTLPGLAPGQPVRVSHKALSEAWGWASCSDQLSAPLLQAQSLSFLFLSIPTCLQHPLPLYPHLTVP